MSRKPTIDTLVERAARIFSDLNMIAAIQTLTEHSLFSPDAGTAESQINKICRRESQLCLARYDRAVDAIKEMMGERGTDTPEHGGMSG